MRDRQSTNPGRVSMKKVGSSTWENYDLKMNDTPSEAGTPLNKVTLLSDDAEDAVFGLNAGDHTVSEAFILMGNSCIRSLDGTPYTCFVDSSHPYYEVTEKFGYNKNAVLTKNYYATAEASVNNVLVKAYNRTAPPPSSPARTITISGLESVSNISLAGDTYGDVVILGTSEDTIWVNVATGSYITAPTYSGASLPIIIGQNDTYLWAYYRKSIDETHDAYYIARFTSSTLAANGTITANHGGSGYSTELDAVNRFTAAASDGVFLTVSGTPRFYLPLGAIQYMLVFTLTSMSVAEVAVSNMGRWYSAKGLWGEASGSGVAIYFNFSSNATTGAQIPIKKITWTPGESNAAFAGVIDFGNTYKLWLNYIGHLPNSNVALLYATGTTRLFLVNTTAGTYTTYAYTIGGSGGGRDQPQTQQKITIPELGINYYAAGPAGYLKKTGNAYVTQPVYNSVSHTVATGVYPLASNVFKINDALLIGINDQLDLRMSPGYFRPGINY